MKYAFIFVATAAAYDYGYGDAKHQADSTPTPTPKHTPTPTPTPELAGYPTIDPGYGAPPVTVTRQNQPYPSCASAAPGGHGCAKWENLCLDRHSRL